MVYTYVDLPFRLWPEHSVTPCTPVQFTLILRTCTALTRVDGLHVRGPAIPTLTGTQCHTLYTCTVHTHSTYLYGFDTCRWFTRTWTCHSDSDRNTVSHPVHLYSSHSLLCFTAKWTWMLTLESNISLHRAHLGMVGKVYIYHKFKFCRYM